MSRIDKAIELATSNKKRVKHVPEIVEGPIAPEGGDLLATKTLTELSSSDIDNPLLVTLNDPNGFAAEQFKKLRSQIIRKTRGEKIRNKLLVTSSIPGEGKTFTAINLAITLARWQDLSVILVDTDLRNPQLHKLLSIEYEYGLAHYLRGEVPLEKVLLKVGVGSLCIIPAGEQMSDPLDLLTGKRMRMLVDELSDSHPDRYVLLDTPPVLPFADIRTLAELVDSFIYVCREGYSDMKQIAQGLEVVNEFDVLGIVCNDISNMKKSEYGQYSGYM